MISHVLDRVIDQLVVFNYFQWVIVAFEWMLELKLIIQLYAIPKFGTRQKSTGFLIKSPLKSYFVA